MITILGMFWSAIVIFARGTVSECSASYLINASKLIDSGHGLRVEIFSVPSATLNCGGIRDVGSSAVSASPDCLRAYSCLYLDSAGSCQSDIDVGGSGCTTDLCQRW